MSNETEEKLRSAIALYEKHNVELINTLEGLIDNVHPRSIADAEMLLFVVKQQRERMKEVLDGTDYS